jgi:hypothetical protein
MGIYNIYTMQSFKYFTYGYPADPRMQIYGLYQPVLNCFLLVLPDYIDIIPRLATILSSRYLLQPVLLNLASNYTHNIIDNEICHDWTFSNVHQVPTRSLMTKFEIINAEQLIPTVVTVDWDIAKEKQWCQFCLFWLKFIRQLENEKFSGLWMDQQLGDNSFFEMFGPVNSPEIRRFVDQVIKLLYLGLDLESTEQAIMDLIDTDSFLQYTLIKHYESTNTANKPG